MTREEAVGVKQTQTMPSFVWKRFTGDEEPLEVSVVDRRWVRWGKDCCLDYFLT